jgi:hypothetical protein
VSRRYDGHVHFNAHAGLAPSIYVG